MQIKSLTLEKLYTPKFKPKRRIDENGYPVTTIIDKLTDKPVEITVRPVKRGGMEQYNLEFKTDGYNYETLGWRFFEVNKIDKKIEPGYMESNSFNRFAGIGLREHQIAIERMLQLGLNDVEILSMSDVIPFHLKSGFTPVAGSKITSYKSKEIDAIIKKLTVALKLDSDTVRKLLNKYKIGSSQNSGYNINFSKLKEDIALYCMDHKLPIQNYVKLDMHLSEKSKSDWMKRIEAQPILMDIDISEPEKVFDGFEYLL